ncbi:MAG: peptidoglycan bridge formation glycyltransferase FemA/FemB family protein, partial [Patescibacteria group bacterium]
LDITKSDGEILAQMKPKGRYNISVAQKRGVRVEQSDDIGAFYRLLEMTGKRDGFGILPKRHYETFLKILPGSFLLMAYAPSPGGKAEGPERGLGGEVEKPLAGILTVRWKSHGIYYYGASDYQSRALMAPYLLQWEAMRHCRTQGCASYDLLGVSPLSPLGGKGSGDRGHWAGVSSFKEKFGGTVVTYPPEQQIVLKPVMNALLQAKRKLIG